MRRYSLREEHRLSSVILGETARTYSYKIFPELVRVPRHYKGPVVSDNKRNHAGLPSRRTLYKRRVATGVRHSGFVWKLAVSKLLAKCLYWVRITLGRFPQGKVPF